MSGPTNIQGWGAVGAELVTDNLPAIGLALVGLVTATVVLAVGQNLLTRAYSAVASLGQRAPTGGGGRQSAPAEFSDAWWRGRGYVRQDDGSWEHPDDDDGAGPSPGSASGRGYDY